MTEKANFLKKVKDFIGLSDYEDEYDDEYEYEEEIEKPVFNKYNKTKKIVNIHTSSNLKLSLHQPEKYEDSTQIISDLKNKKPVVVNLQILEDDKKRKVFDFMSGAIFALEGTIQKVAKDVFILAPINVEVDSNVKEELKSKGMFHWMK